MSYFLRILLWSVFVSYCTANDKVIYREYTWHNFKDFIDYGWREEFPGTTKTYSTPTEMDPKLFELNHNFTDEVWGWKPSEVGRSTMRYILDLDKKPEYCGILNATVSFKYYLEGNTGGGGNSDGYGSYVWPGCSGVHTKCYVPTSDFGTWTTVENNILLSKALFVGFHVRLAGTGLVLIDEVRFSYTVSQGIDCPYSCDHDCEYRPTDCHYYYTCVDRLYKEFRTCDKNEGLAFNPVTKSCDLIENVPGCNGEKPPPPPHCVCEYRPHETNCSLYYYCPDTCKLEECEVRRCPSGLLWSIDSKGDGSGQQQCTHSRNASCYNDGSTTEPAVESSTDLWETSTGVFLTSEIRSFRELVKRKAQ